MTKHIIYFACMLAMMMAVTITSLAQDKLSFYANGVKLTDYNDSSFAYGHIGLYAGTQSEGNVTIGFDNLKVWGMK